MTAISAFAQSAVTIGGYLGGSLDNFRIGNINAARAGNSSENRVSDQSSRLMFNVAEDLGNGLSAVGQYDLRFKIDAAARIQSETSTTSPAVDPVTNGNIHVGLSSNNWGAVKLGRQDIHYTEQANLLPGGLYLAANQAPVVYGLQNSAIANWSRTPNLLWYVSPRISGVEASVGYSTNPLRTSATTEVEADVGSTTPQRKGSAQWLKLNYANGPLDMTFSRYDAKSDYMGSASTGAGAGGTAVNPQNDQLSQTLLVKYRVTPELRVALGRTANELTAVTAATAANSATAFNPAYAIGDKIKASANHASIGYQMGASNITLNWAKRGNVSYAGNEVDNTALTQTTLAYTYDLSKRTSVGVMYTALKAGTKTSGNLFYQGNNAYGGQVTAGLGETQTITSLALRHNF